YEVRAAVNGSVALKAIREYPPDLILLDIMMPVMNGYEVCERLKADERSRDIPVIFLSALNETLDKVEAFSVGGVDYITKPFQKAELLARVNAHLSLRRLQQKVEEQNIQLQASLDKVKILSGLLPICAHCNKIRDDKGYWEEVVVYIRNHSEAEFSHGICPDCVKEFYPEVYEEPDEQSQDILAALKKLGPWGTLEDISAEIGLPESDIVSSLQKMVVYGQIRRMELEGQRFYRLAD
ncbi:MAG: response regulator, partial [Planctomycetes bacterium]|nr:response regulator [Planctomycetota bacterium]